MNEDLKVELGTFVENVLAHPAFSVIVSEFERTTSQQLLATKPDHCKTRESIYQTFNGARTFLGFFKQFADLKHEVIESRARKLDEDTLDY